MKTFVSFYTPNLPSYLVYMLQQVEYDPKKFLDWLERLFKDNDRLSSVRTRKSLIKTSKVYALLGLSIFILLAVVAISLLFVGEGLPIIFTILHVGIALIAYPFLLILSLAAVSYVSWRVIVAPRQNKLITASKNKLAVHPATKIAVIGSYGKTTMKELLVSILSEGKEVAATPGNMNTAYSQARFISSLAGNEEVVIVEFGEGEPGDVAKMSRTIQPDYAIITGLAPNHLDFYPSLDAVAEDLLSVREESEAMVYANAESELLRPHLKSIESFTSQSVLGWTIHKPVISVTGVKFQMKKGKKSLSMSAGLLGRHQIAPIAFGAALADKLGLSKSQIERGCSRILPFEHRMQPRNIGGGWIIDDTYNGNIEGLVAGLKLLSELDFKKKWYVTPGLVDQGPETERVHQQLGKAIATYNPDVVVLMENSARPTIEAAMKKHGFNGELRIQLKPLEFYTSIEHQLAAGDIVLMQNDWTDNYN